MRVLREFPSREIDSFGSHGFLHSRLARGEQQVEVARLTGTIGGHPGASRQLFYVASGRTETEEAELGPGEAALWEPGEWHESRALEPSLVVIVQGEFEPFA